MSDRIYLDHNATTPTLPEVRQAVLRALEDFGNPSSVHQEGQRAKGQLETARRSVADLLQASPREIIFTSGGTEANNLALFSHLRTAKPSSPQEVIVTRLEHPAILKPLQSLENEKAIQIRWLPVTAQGTPDLTRLPELLNSNTVLFCLMLVNNELGTIFPVREAAEAVRRTHPTIKIHCDAIQAVGRLPVCPAELQVDSLSLSAHKFYGPKGVGALWCNRAEDLLTRSFGGGQETGRRSGTENLPGIAGLGAAARVAREKISNWQQRLEPLRDEFEQLLAQRIADVRINGGAAARLCTTSNVHIRGVPGDLLQQALDLAGISVSTGSACSSGTVSPSATLLALGQERSQALQAIRVSFGESSSREQMLRTVEAIVQAVSRIREML